MAAARGVAVAARGLSVGRAGMPLLLIAPLVIVGLLALMWLTQRSLVYFPSPGPVLGAASVLPGAEDVELVTSDRVRLGAWFVPASGKVTGITVLVCNGNAGDRSYRAGFARGLARAGHAVLLFDYRGFGGNPGAPTETGLRADARAALDHLVSRPGLDPARIVYFGESLGAAVAAQLASERPPYALVLRSPFTTLADVGRFHYPYLPVVDALLQDRYRTVDALQKARAPVLVVAGDRDRIVPLHLSRRLYEGLPGPRRFAVLPGDHNDPALAEGPVLVAELTRFLDEVREGVLPQR